MSKHTDPGPQSPDEGGQDVTPPNGETTALQEYNAEVLDSQPGIREAFMLMLAEVPDPPPDAAAAIVGAILSAQSVEDIDKPWDAEGMRDLKDRSLLVREVHKMPSDYAQGLGVYLVCRVVTGESGEEKVVTTGSVSIVAQLVRAHTLGALPLLVIPREAKKPSRNGYLPMHLELVRGRGTL